MQDDTPITQDSATNEQPSDIEAGFDAEDVTTSNGEVKNTDEAGRDSLTPEAETDKAEVNGEADAEDVKAHNRKFAEARIAAKQQAEEANISFLEELRDDIYSSIDQPDESLYDEIAEEQGEHAALVQKQLDELRARDEQREAEAFVARVEQQRNFIGTNIAQAESKIPLFNPDSKDYDAELHDAVLADWAAANLETFTDNNGNVQILGLKEDAVTPFEYLSKRAEVMMRVIGNARTKGQAAAERNAQQAEPMSSSSIVNTQQDDFSRGFDLG